jgi:hypothetical protein
MTKGIVVLAQNNKKTNYVLQACLLAMSLKATNPNTKISIITNNRVPAVYKSLFDKIIKIPWSDAAKKSEWKVENRWKVYHVTPYNETMVLDTDMLVLQDIDSWWKFLSKYELFFTSNVQTYRGELVTDDFYRKTFTINNLPNLYSGLYYFKKCNKAHEFFVWLELVINNWELFYSKHASEYYNKWLSLDVSTAIVSKILDNDNEITNKRSKIPTFTHMKPKIQGWNEKLERWQDAVGVYITDDCKLKIGNYYQYGIFHYTEDSFVTDDIINVYRKHLNV